MLQVTKVKGHLNGYSGPKGEDGFSPTIETREIENGYIISITDINGEQEIELDNGVSDHSKLENLNYEDAGHIGFQEEMTPLTNIEIERMFENE